MANPTFRASANSGAQTAATFSVNKPAGTIDGDLLVAFQATVLGGGVAPVAPTNWSIQGSHLAFGGAADDLVVWYKLAASEPASWTFNNATGGAGVKTAVYVIAVQGPPASTPEGTKTAIGTSGTADPGVYATLAANNLLLVAWAIGSSIAPAITPDASFTPLGIIGDTTLGLNVGYKSQVAIGNTSLTTATLDSSEAWGAILAAIAGGAAASGGGAGGGGGYAADQPSDSPVLSFAARMAARRRRTATRTPKKAV